MPSTASEIWRALRFLVPLKSKCSMKWQTPFSSAGSYREPTATQNPRLTLVMCGISALAIVRPLSKRLTRYILALNHPCTPRECKAFGVLGRNMRASYFDRPRDCRSPLVSLFYRLFTGLTVVWPEELFFWGSIGFG